MKSCSLIFAIFLSLTASISLQADTEDKIKAELLQKLASAATETEGRQAEDALWRFWFNQAPTAEIRDLLDAGVERIQAYDFEAAENTLNQVVEAAPEFAEGYNRRAFARFLRENFSDSLTDLEKTLELEPHHFGAMAGMYQILRIQNRTPAAMELLRQAVTIHPWLKERGALPEEMWPESYRRLHEPGQEI